MGFSVLVGNIFIIDEHNDDEHQIYKWMSIIVGNPNLSDTYLFLSLICSTQELNFSTFFMICSDKGNVAGVAVGNLNTSVAGSGYGPHYL